MITDTRNKLFSYITMHKKARVHDMVKAFHLSHVAIHKQLVKLLQDGKIQKIGKPPVVFYTQNKQALDLEEIKQKVIPVLKKAGVTKSSLFGSYVRGEQTAKSDVDILVDFPEDFSLFDVAGLQYEIEEKLGKDVDLVGFKNIKPRLKQYILPEQVRIL